MTALVLKKRILFGVYILYVLRKLKSPFILESCFFLALFGVLFSTISVSSVLGNMSHSADAYRYFMAAFSKTTSFVQMTTLLLFVPFFFFVRNVTVRTFGLWRMRSI